ncbi:MAG: very short patch repair endonuclease [Alphaproteobacteria bacterium]
MNRSENMCRIKSKETLIEIKLRKVLWSKGYRYRKNCKDIYGKPDICFKGKKIAIFCDSEFWHGKNFYNGKDGVDWPKTNVEFWKNKIAKNIARDKEVNDYLEKEGWRVLRFWSKDILQNTLWCIEIIENALKS